jgi:hypothetical protein
MSTRPAGRWVRSEDVLWRHLPDGVLLLTARLSEPLAVRGSAAAPVWEDLVEPARAEELVAAVVAEAAAGPEGAAPLEVDPAIVAADVDQVLDSLIGCGAVEPAGR